MAFMIESEGKRMLNWADTCNHYVVAIQRPDIELDVDDDKAKAVAARKRILEMASKEGLLVAGYHMPFPGLGYIDKTAGRLPLAAAHLSDANLGLDERRTRSLSCPRKRGIQYSRR